MVIMCNVYFLIVFWLCMGNILVCKYYTTKCSSMLGHPIGNLFGNGQENKRFFVLVLQISLHLKLFLSYKIIYTMEYYSAIKKNTFESVLMRWMKLEPIIQSEVSQKEKHQYIILMHIYGI